VTTSAKVPKSQLQKSQAPDTPLVKVFCKERHEDAPHFRKGKQKMNALTYLWSDVPNIRIKFSLLEELEAIWGECRLGYSLFLWGVMARHFRSVPRMAMSMSWTKRGGGGKKKKRRIIHVL